MKSSSRRPPTPSPVPARKHAEQQELGFVGDATGQGKADRLAGSAIPCDDERNAVHRQDPGALRASPCFAKAVAESRVHDLHDGVEVGRIAGAQADIAVDRGGRHQAASFARASGARA